MERRCLSTCPRKRASFSAARFEVQCNAAMEFAALNAEKTLVDRLARKRVAKPKIVAALFDDELQSSGPRESAPDFFARRVERRLEYGRAEAPPDYGGLCQDLELGGRKRFEALENCGADRRRQTGRRTSGGARFERVLEKLLGKQGVPIGELRDRGECLGW